MPARKGPKGQGGGIVEWDLFGWSEFRHTSFMHRPEKENCPYGCQIRYGTLNDSKSRRCLRRPWRTALRDRTDLRTLAFRANSAEGAARSPDRPIRLAMGQRKRIRQGNCESGCDKPHRSEVGRHPAGQCSNARQGLKARFSHERIERPVLGFCTFNAHDPEGQGGCTILTFT